MAATSDESTTMNWETARATCLSKMIGSSLCRLPTLRELDLMWRNLKLAGLGSFSDPSTGVYGVRPQLRVVPVLLRWLPERHQ